MPAFRDEDRGTVRLSHLHNHKAYEGQEEARRQHISSILIFFLKVQSLLILECINSICQCSILQLLIKHEYLPIHKLNILFSMSA